jgi:hypothetical protein
MRGRFGWLGAGVLLVGLVGALLVGYTALAQTNVLAGLDQTERAVEPPARRKNRRSPSRNPKKK